MTDAIQVTGLAKVYPADTGRAPLRAVNGGVNWKLTERTRPSKNDAKTATNESSHPDITRDPE